MSHRKLLAVDPSLTCSGWALFEVDSGSLVAFGGLRTLPPTTPLAERLLFLQSKVTGLFDSLNLPGRGDMLICEGPTTMRDPKAAFKVEQVRGIFETVARERGILVPGRLNPRTVHRELLAMKGRQMSRAIVKEQAIRVAISLYGESFRAAGVDPTEQSLARHQDVVDAVLLGTVGVERVRSACRAGVGLAQMFAM